LIWREPNGVADRGPSAEGAPKPPYSFNEEAGGGTSPKIVVYDSARRMWEVKWGPEAKSEVFASWFLGSVGYFIEPSYFVASGAIDSVGQLSRAASKVDRGSGNSFTNARFELRDRNTFLVPAGAWSLVDNPFKHSNEFAGLKIMSMLVSNWDLKDPRATDGSNTSIVKVKLGVDASEIRYIVNDWGATMGKWGGVMGRSKWDCSGYTSQTRDFVKGVEGGRVKFGYEGKFTDDVAGGVTVEHVRWLMPYLGRITDDQLRSALEAAGATSSETSCYVPAIRSRIEQLKRASN